MADPLEWVVKKLPYDLSSHGGLALVGRLFKRINLPAMVDPQYPVRAGIANSGILQCYLALLTLGKNDFEAVDGLRSQRFDAMGSGHLPLDIYTFKWNPRTAPLPAFDLKPAPSLRLRQVATGQLRKIA